MIIRTVLSVIVLCILFGIVWHSNFQCIYTRQSSVFVIRLSLDDNGMMMNGDGDGEGDGDEWR